PQSPVFELSFAPEHQRELEQLLAALPAEVFKASDSLGWVNRPRFSRQSRSSKNNAIRTPPAVAAADSHVVVCGCKTFQCSQRRQPWPVHAWGRLFDEYARVLASDRSLSRPHNQNNGTADT